jgi:hypothetical protein
MDTDNKKQQVRAAEDQFKQQLLELGLLTEITPPLDEQAVPDQREPALVVGNPVSELIMKERR